MRLNLIISRSALNMKMMMKVLRGTGEYDRLISSATPLGTSAHHIEQHARHAPDICQDYARPQAQDSHRREDRKSVYPLGLLDRQRHAEKHECKQAHGEPTFT